MKPFIRSSRHSTLRKVGKVIISFICILLTSVALNAQLIWYADPAISPGDLFKNIGTGNVESPSTISTTTDATRGTVWRFHKPSGSNRCENHGIKVNGSGYAFQNNTVYYLGWWTKLTNTSDNNAVFQWKSYDNHTQNFPFVLRMRSGNLQLMQRQPGAVETILLNKPFSANTWYHIVIGVRVDDELQGGWVELYFNGVQQTFTTGTQRFACRTLDGGHNCPKWGVYGRSDLTITNFLDDIKVGQTYADVAMSTPPPTGDFSGYYRLTPRHSGKALVVQSASTDNSAAVVQYTYGGSSTNDEWELTSIGSGYYRIINRNSGKDMVVQSASTADGAAIIQYTYGGSNTNDEWQFVDNGGGYYRIVNRMSGKVVEVAGSSTSDGAAVNQRTWSGGTNQQFQLESLGSLTAVQNARMDATNAPATSRKDEIMVQNPFKQHALIKLSLAEAGMTQLAVYDQMGRQVAVIVNERLNAGIHTVNFEAKGFAAGTYFLKLTRNGKHTTRQLIKE